MVALANGETPMRSAFAFLSLGGVAMAALGFVVPSPVGAQSHPQIPNFMPYVDTGWTTTSNDYYPPSHGAIPVTFDPAYPYVGNRQAEQPTFRVADLTNPNLKPWVAEAMKEPNEIVIAGGMGFTPRSACMPAGTPAFFLYIREPVYIFQGRDTVLILYSGNSEMRRVHMNVSHADNPTPTWYGDSIGHYEGDTLVVDTIALDTRSYVDLYRTPHTGNLHVVERWRMTNGGNELEVQFTVEDEGAFYTPWSGSQLYRRVNRPIEELPCAENNRITEVAGHPVPTATSLDF
jgi:hypothetical protein